MNADELIHFIFFDLWPAMVVIGFTAGLTLAWLERKTEDVKGLFQIILTFSIIGAAWPVVLLLTLSAAFLWVLTLPLYGIAMAIKHFGNEN